MQIKGGYQNGSILALGGGIDILLTGGGCINGNDRSFYQYYFIIKFSMNHIFNSASGQQVTVRAGSYQAINQTSIERVSEDYQATALRDILVSFRTEITNVLPSVAQQKNIQEKIQRRLGLLESQIDGLIRKKSFKGLSIGDGGRELDYSNLLLEKENEIIRLQRKINALENQYSVAKVGQVQGDSVSDLKLKIAKLTAELANRQQIIKAKNEFIISEFNHYAETRDYFHRVKNTFDRTQNKGELRNLFDGIQLPPSADRDFRIHDLSQGTIKPRKGLTGEVRVRAEISALIQDLQSIRTFTQASFQETLKNFFIGVDDSGLKQLFRIQSQYDLLFNRFRGAASIWQSQLKDLRRQFPTARIQIDRDITKLLQDSRIDVIIVNDVIQLQPNPIVQVPMPESRTSQLLQLVSVQLRSLLAKYPKLQVDVDRNVLEFFNEGVIDTLAVGGDINRIVEIVKYVPQEIRVDNVYSFRSDKHSRVQYHLRVLVKALLEELERLRVKTGQVLELDESVIKMIREQILDIVNVDDILKVFKVNTKIVQVQKVIEKIVEKVVEVPQIIPIEKIVQKIIEVPKIQEIERIVHVPVEIVKLVDNVVQKIVEVERVLEIIKEVPKYIEKVVEKIVQVPKVVEVEKIVQKVIVETKIVQVERIVQVPTIQVREVQIIKEIVVPVQTIVERIVQVPVYVQKLVQRVVNVPQIIQVQKVVEKVVRDTEFKIVKQNNVEVEVAIEIVDRVVEKIVIVDNYVEKILEVPKIIEKVVVIKQEVFEVKEVEVIREKIVPVYQIKEIERVVNTITPLIKEVEKVIERKVEVPFYQEKIIIVPQIINRIEIQHVEVPRIIEVERIVEKPVVVNNIVEVEKPVVHYVKDYQIIKSVVEKIIPVPKIVERIKQVKVNVQKLIEKMVEIPKVVEVEKVVEKIVVVPRIIEKIVEVPQIVERIVQRIVEVQKIIEIEKEVQIPVFTEKIVEVEVVKNVYIEVEKIVDRVVEKIVPVETIVEKLVEINNEVERVVVINNQIPKPVQVERVVFNTFEVEKIFQIEKPITIPVEVPVEVEKIVEKIVVIQKNIQKIVQVPQLIEKIIEVNSETVQVQVVEKIVQRIIPKNVINTVPVDNLVVQNQYQEIPKVVEKLVPVREVVNQIVEVEKIVEKVIERVIEVPRIIEVERIVEKVIKVPEVHTLEKIVPQLIRVNNIVETFIEKIISIPFREEVIKTIQTNSQKIVPVKQTGNQITTVDVFRDKIIQIERLVEVIQTQNFVTKELEVVERFQEKEIPIFSTIEKIIEVPHILEKIVEKIVVLPQVVEILKNVHQIAETLPAGIQIPNDIAAHQAQYRTLSSNLRKSLDQVVGELRKLKTQQPNMKQSIQIIERMLVDLDRAVNFSRVVAVPQEVIVRQQVSRPVLIHENNIEFNHTLALSLLTEKLVQQLRRLRAERSDLKFKLDEEVSLIFFPELGGGSTTGLLFENQLRSYTESVLGKFRTLGGWKSDHELLLFNTLQERFTHAQLLKDLNEQIKKTRKAAEDVNNENKQLRLANSAINENIKKLQGYLTRFVDRARNDNNYADAVRDVSRFWQDLLTTLNRNINSFYPQVITSPVTIVHAEGSQSGVREALAQNQLLIKRIANHEFGPVEEQNLRLENARLRDQVTRLRSHNLNNDEYEKVINDLRSQLTTFSSSRVTLNTEEQMRNDYERKLREQAQNYEKLIGGLKTGNTLNPTAIQFVDRVPELYQQSRRSSNQNTARLQESSRLENSSRLQNSVNRLEQSRRSSNSNQNLTNSKTLSKSNIHAIGHSNVVPAYYYMPGQQPTFKS